MDLQNVLTKIYEKKGDKFLLELRYLNLTFSDVSEFIESQKIENFWHVIENHFHDGGWGMGYVRIVEGHPLYEVEYYDENFNEPLVHGGVTWSEYGLPNSEHKNHWFIGFDTNHYGDNIKNWSEHSVIEETIKLFCDVYHIKI